MSDVSRFPRLAIGTALKHRGLELLGLRDEGPMLTAPVHVIFQMSNSHEFSRFLIP